MGGRGKGGKGLGKGGAKRHRKVLRTSPNNICEQTTTLTNPTALSRATTYTICAQSYFIKITYDFTRFVKS
jgi:hypothetical protein